MRRQFPRWVGRLLAAAVVSLCLVRAAAFLAYAWYSWPSQSALWPSEAKMVTYASWARDVRELYPSGSDYPYEVNWISPAYFWLVGGIGRWSNASIAELFLIGRAVTVVSVLAATVLVGWSAARYGRIGVIAAVSTSLGSGLLVGFGVMARPDLLADCLGFAGFLLATRARGRAALMSSGACLAVACLTRQAAVWYAVASLLAVTAETRRIREAAMLTAWFVAVMSIVIVPVQLSSEPHLAASLVGGSSAQMHWTQLRDLFAGRVWPNGSDVVVMTLAGAWMWRRGEYHDRSLVILTVLGWLGAIVCLATTGADFNGFLGLRLIAALAAAALCHALWQAPPTPRAWAYAAVGILAVASLVGPTRIVVQAALGAKRAAVAARSSEGLAAHRGFIMLCSQVALSPYPILTDAEEIAVYQTGRAPFIDSRVFRMRVDTGLLHPAGLEDRLRSQEFAALVLREDVHRQGYGSQAWEMPERIARIMRDNYVPNGQASGYYVYLRRLRGSDER